MKIYLLGLLLLPVYALSQGYRPGYVITASGDTVHGLLKHPFGNIYGFRFKDLNGTERKFSEPEVIGYFIGNDGLFRRIPFERDGQLHMVRVIEEGYLSLYYFRQGESSDHRFTILQLKDTQNQFSYSDDLFSGFKKGILNYLAGDPDLCEKIKNGEDGKKDIIRIVKDYNAFIAAKKPE